MKSLLLLAAIVSMPAYAFEMGGSQLGGGSTNNSGNTGAEKLCSCYSVAVSSIYLGQVAGSNYGQLLRACEELGGNFINGCSFY